VVASGDDTGGSGTPDGGTAGTDDGVPDAGCTSHAACDDGDPCTQDVCGIDGACAHPPAEDGVLCDDGDLQTVNDACKAGVCQGVTVDCTALDGACVTGTFDAAQGKCVAQPAEDGTDCDDGDPATESDVCTAGVCAGTAVDCSSLDGACVAGVFHQDQGGCVAEPVDDGTSCASPCGEGVCQAGACELLPDVCDDEDPCTTDVCGETGCQHASNPICSTPNCGDGTCEQGEDSTTCPEDCGGASECGDGVCDPGESPASCPEDCAGDLCGDTFCDDAIGEDIYTCPVDCGPLNCDSENDCPWPQDPCMARACKNGTCVAEPLPVSEVAMGVVAGGPEILSTFWAAHPGLGSGNVANVVMDVRGAPVTPEGWLTGNDSVGYTPDFDVPRGLFDVALSSDGTKQLTALVTGAFAAGGPHLVSNASEEGGFYFAVRATDSTQALEMGGVNLGTTGAVSDAGGLWCVGLGSRSGSGSTMVSPFLGLRRTYAADGSPAWVQVDQVRLGEHPSDTGLPGELFVDVWAQETFELLSFDPSSDPSSGIVLQTSGATGQPGAPPSGGARYVLWAGDPGEGAVGLGVWPAYWPASDSSWSIMVPLPMGDGGVPRFVMIFGRDSSVQPTLPGWEDLEPLDLGYDDVAVVSYEGGEVVRALKLAADVNSPGPLVVTDASTDGDALVLTGRLGVAIVDLGTGQEVVGLPAKTFAVSFDVSQGGASAGQEPLTPLSYVTLSGLGSEAFEGLQVAGDLGQGFVLVGGWPPFPEDTQLDVSMDWFSLTDWSTTSYPLPSVTDLHAPVLMGLGPGGSDAMWGHAISDGGIPPTVMSLGWMPDGRVVLGGDFDNVAGSLQLQGQSGNALLPPIHMEFMGNAASWASFAAVVGGSYELVCGY